MNSFRIILFAENRYVLRFCAGSGIWRIVLNLLISGKFRFHPKHVNKIDPKLKKIVTLKFNFVVVGCCGCCGRNENSILIVSMNHSHRPYCRFGLKQCATILIYHFPHLTLNVPLSLSLSLSHTHTHTFTFSLSLFHLYDLQILSLSYLNIQKMFLPLSLSPSSLSTP